MNKDLQKVADLLQERVTELLLSLWDSEDDRHPETGQMYSSCAQAWLAVDNYRKQTSSYGGSIAPTILQEATEALDEDEQTCGAPNLVSSSEPAGTPLGSPSFSLNISAQCHSDDYAYDVSFDAAPWFQQASDEAIKDLAEWEWGGNYPADDVAVFCKVINPNLAALFNYVRGKKDCGFECYVTESDALTWLKVNRPLLFAALSEHPHED